MANIDLEMFMEKLRRLLYENYNNTPIENNPYIEAKKPEIKLLYEELSYLIGSCFKDMTNIDEELLDDLEDVGNWKRRLIEAAEEAEVAVDMFLSSASAIIKNDIRDIVFADRQKIVKSNLLDCSLTDLKNVTYVLKCMREEMINKDNSENLFQNLVKQDMTYKKFEGTGTSNATVNFSTTQHEELIVGFDDDALLIIDRLTGYRKKLDIISIVGMGGLGKTTLATKIFNDSLVKYHFDMRGWITVSQEYSMRDMLLQLLASIGKSVHEAAGESKLCEMLYQSLKGRRYLIVIDDVWSSKAWDDVARCFPDDNTGSRVLVTTRLTEIASHASQGGFAHNLGHLNADQSWELLCKKTFRGYECPESLIETGKHIAKQCGGLPLALVVIAGLLEKGEKTKDLWGNIAVRVGSYIINDPNGCLDTLALSYDHLPSHLKKCFLYAGGFPEDYKIQVRTLIRLWMAEGFIKESHQRSLEEDGEYHLMDLIDRNLLVVADKRSNGGIKSCRLHDLLRELCLRKASEENFLKSYRNFFYNSASRMVKQLRLFIDSDIGYPPVSARNARSVLYFDTKYTSSNWGCCAGVPGYHKTASWVGSFLLLRVLDLQSIPMVDFRNIRLLIHLRYLAVWSRSHDFLFSKAELCNLQTLIVKGKFQSFIYWPDNMVNLRHLRCDRIDTPFHFRFPKPSFNLQTLSRIKLDHSTLWLFVALPNIKKLGCSIVSKSSLRGLSCLFLLSHLEALNIDNYMYESLTLTNSIRFPQTLKKLTLKGLCLPWNYMSTIQRLPKLEVLKLLDSSFKGHLWEIGDQQFRQLKYLKLEKLNIRDWEASSTNFPCLRKLIVRSCEDLKEIPLELGNICTLEHIEIDHSNSSVLKSVNKIQEAQREIGNHDIHVNFTHMDRSESYFEGDPFYE